MRRPASSPTSPTSIAASAWRRASRTTRIIPVFCCVRCRTWCVSLQRFWPAYMKKPFRSADEINDAALAWLDARPEGPPGVHLPQLSRAASLASRRRPTISGRAICRTPASWRARACSRTPFRRGSARRSAEFITANYDGQILADGRRARRAASQALQAARRLRERAHRSSPPTTASCSASTTSSATAAA